LELLKLEGVLTMKLNVLDMQSIPTSLKDINVFKKRRRSKIMKDLGLLILRLGVGGLLAGHGSQKLFGWFSGPGLKGTAGWLESLGLRPGTSWATAASASEFGGGVLTTLGFLHPLGPLGTVGAMIMATAKAHWGKPIWVSQGGAELPVTNMTAALALTLTGPGRFSLDNLFGIKLPRAMVIAVAIIEAVMIGIGVTSGPKPSTTSASQDQGETPDQATRPAEVA
jgi:putative oxidoreductase